MPSPAGLLAADGLYILTGAAGTLPGGVLHREDMAAILGIREG